ncbi:golgin subfamily A member 7/ERF4 family domain-containing protein [Ditylenchus destructor]|nr:golgin subfamily A member 7/ERF4 family domain-containing protein [Ditylenchus destructor]
MSEKTNLIPRKVALNECRKFYVQRDFSHGLSVAFSTDYPEELNNKIQRDAWIDFIKELNKIYAEAEIVSASTVAESMLLFFTCYLSRLCTKSIWDAKLEEVCSLLNEMNESHFIKEGVFVRDPIEKGLRVIEVVLLNEPMPVQSPTQNNKCSTTPLQPR